MAENTPHKGPKTEATLVKQVGAKAARKLEARHHTEHRTWFGLSMMGMVGWSVVVPTLLGTALGVWLDEHYPSKHHFTLALLIAGLLLGCFNAWHWIDKESRAMRKGRDDNGR